MNSTLSAILKFSPSEANKGEHQGLLIALAIFIVFCLLGVLLFDCFECVFCVDSSNAFLISDSREATLIRVPDELHVSEPDLIIEAVEPRVPSIRDKPLYIESRKEMLEYRWVNDQWEEVVSEFRSEPIRSRKNQDQENVRPASIEKF